MTIDPRLHRIVAARPYPLVFATISGAHLYGFPSPDSDYDLRGTHILPVGEVVGLDPGQETVQLETKDDVLEQVFSPLVVHTTPAHEELKVLARNCITRHHSHHYLGFAATQWKLFDK